MPTKRWIEQDGPDVLLRLRVQPNASRNVIHQNPDGGWRVSLTARPVDGAANKSLCALVAKSLGIAKGRVQLARGLTSREKTLRIDGVTVDEVESSLLI